MRPLMLDALDWVDGWPVVRGGRFASDTLQAQPAAQPGDPARHRKVLAAPQRCGAALPAFSRSFDGHRSIPLELGARARDGAWGLEGGMLRFDTQVADLFGGSSNGSVP